MLKYVITKNTQTNAYEINIGVQVHEKKSNINLLTTFKLI